MKRISKIFYKNNEGSDVFSINDDGKAHIEKYYFTSADLEELATIASAAAEELRSLEERQEDRAQKAAGLEL